MGWPVRTTVRKRSMNGVVAVVGTGSARSRARAASAGTLEDVFAVGIDVAEAEAGDDAGWVADGVEDEEGVEAGFGGEDEALIFGGGFAVGEGVVVLAPDEQDHGEERGGPDDGLGAAKVAGDGGATDRAG